MNGKLISFEGIEGSGKSTQIEKLKKHYEDSGHKVLCLREPGGTTFGENLRSAILSSSVKIDPYAEALLFASSRAQLLQEKIIPFLNDAKNIVLVDRFIDSSFAYQGHARGLGIDNIEKIHSIFPLSIRPDKTFYLKIDLHCSMERQKKRGNTKDYFEKETHEFYLKLIEGFNTLANREKRIITIDAQNDIDTIFNNILDNLK